MSTEAIIDQVNNTRYHQYIEYLGDLCLVTEALDKRIRVLRKYVGKTFTTKQEADARMEPAVTMARELLADTNPLDRNVRMNDYFRLLAHASLASEMVLAPSVFASDDMDARQKLADGTTGTAAHIIENALDLYEHVGTDNPEIRSHASGIINEFSAIGLVNLEEDGTKIMLPSSQYSDMFDKVDADYYGMRSVRKLEKRYRNVDAQPKHFRTSIQIKSRFRPPNGTVAADEISRSEDVAYIFASDFNNQVTPKQRFPISRLLISEMNGVEEIAYQREILNEQSQNIENRVRGQKNDLNTELL